ncbi:MAG TPA: hypothetical protein VNC39_00070, partial [Acidocella sp.]|uniref:hypothetical protein n=1 Tax=Acidocella sp. TaxID=50710 RepID=UPI002CA1D1A8
MHRTLLSAATDLTPDRTASSTVQAIRFRTAKAGIFGRRFLVDIIQRKFENETKRGGQHEAPGKPGKTEREENDR